MDPRLKRSLLRLVGVIVLALVAWAGRGRFVSTAPTAPTTTAPVPTAKAPTAATPAGKAGSGATTASRGAAASDGGARAVAEAFRTHASDVQLTVAGHVTKLLPDDTDGIEHQKFIVRLSDGATLLVAHNTDLARRVPVREGDFVEIHGEYEWSAQGGVMHWTHRDPKGHHEGGWIMLQGKKYE